MEAGVVIVGASTAGLCSAEALRAEGYAGPLTVVGAEPYLPYTRPPLSKRALLQDFTADDLAILSATEIANLDIALRLNYRADRLDILQHTVYAGKDAVEYSKLIIATGASAAPLTMPSVASVHTLRTVEDAAAIRSALAGARRVVVVGAGVLGAEVAAAARQRRCEVTLVGRSTAIRLGLLGSRLSEPLKRLLSANGVALELGVQVFEVREAQGRVEGVVLSDGRARPCDLVITAVGSVPSTDWLAGSGLDVSDGVLCDASGKAAQDVFAVGDVARWFNPATGVAERTGHQQNAIDQALIWAWVCQGAGVSGRRARRLPASARSGRVRW